MNIKTLSSSGYNLWADDVSSDDCIGNGIIEIENGFQMIGIPIIEGWWNPVTHKHVHNDGTTANVYNYIITQIEDTYGVAADTMIEVCNTLIGGQGSYWNFVPGVTNPLSPHNFQMSYLDSGAGSQEVTGFFIKSIHPTSFTIKWGDQ